MTAPGVDGLPRSEPPARLAARRSGISHGVDEPLIKGATEEKEQHEARLGARALPMFDVRGYVDDFNASIVGAYAGGRADSDLPADPGVARSVIPPGTAAARDFSGLAPRIPEFLREACVGCMSCVNACPDTAILAVAQPGSVVEAAIAEHASREDDPEHAASDAHGHFARTTKYEPTRYATPIAAVFIDRRG